MVLARFVISSTLFLQRLPAQSEEDVYIQCEEIDDGIYSNDQEFNPKPPEPHDEDVYLMPDSWREDFCVKRCIFGDVYEWMDEFLFTIVLNTEILVRKSFKDSVRNTI